MKSNMIILAAAIVLSLSILFSAIYLGYAILKMNEANQATAIQSEQPLLMDSDEAAQYLGIQTETLVAKVKKERIEKASLAVYDTYRFIPFLEIDGVIYFTRSELVKWAEYQTINR